MDCWTGRIEHCVLVADLNIPQEKSGRTIGTQVQCPAPQNVPYNATPNQD
jgi:hypothetical protein